MGPHKWKRIAERVPGRDHIQCIQRWKKVREQRDGVCSLFDPSFLCNPLGQALDPTLRKGQWTKEEDEILQRIKLADPAMSW
jgi:hypothetical protein